VILRWMIAAFLYPMSTTSEAKWWWNRPEAWYWRRCDGRNRGAAKIPAINLCDIPNQEPYNTQNC